MSSRRLGRGLDALLTKAGGDKAGGEDVQNSEAVVVGERTPAGEHRLVPIDQIHRSPYQPRRTFDQAALAELANSIRHQGLLQPIVLRPRAVGGYELIAGERRWRAAQLAELDALPALIRQVSDEQASALALIENIQREDLKPLEEAQALVRLREEFSLTHEEVAEAVGKSRTAVTNLMRLLNLAPRARMLLESGALEAGHARALLALPDTLQDQAAQEVANRKLSVRQTEQLVKRLLSASNSRQVAKPPKDADTRVLERELSEKLGAQVTIDHASSGKGTLTIRYGNLEQLDGVLRHFR